MIFLNQLLRLKDLNGIDKMKSNFIYTIDILRMTEIRRAKRRK